MLGLTPAFAAIVASRSAQAPAPSFSPASLFAASEDGAWYDPSDLTTLFQNSNGTGAVTADGDPVGYMGDRSGNGHHMIQPAGAARPTYRTDGTLHWLQNDTGDFMYVPTPGLGLVDLGWWIAAEETAAVNNAGVMSFGADAGQDWAVADGWAIAAGNASRHFDATAAMNLSLTVDGTGPTPLAVWEAQKSATVATLYQSGVERAVDNGFTALDATHTGSLFLGVRSNGADVIDTNTHLRGNFYGVIIRCASSTPEEQAATRTWLGAKAGLSI